MLSKDPNERIKPRDALQSKFITKFEAERRD